MKNIKNHIGSLIVIIAFIIIATSSKKIGEFIFGFAWPVDSINCDWLPAPVNTSIDIEITCYTGVPWWPVEGITMSGLIVHYQTVEHPSINFTCVREAKSVYRFSGTTNSIGELIVKTPEFERTGIGDGLTISVTTVANDEYLSTKHVSKTLLDRTFNPDEINLTMTKKDEL